MSKNAALGHPVRAIRLKPIVAFLANAMHARFGLRTQASDPAVIMVPVSTEQICRLGLKRQGETNVYVS